MAGRAGLGAVADVRIHCIELARTAFMGYWLAGTKPELLQFRAGGRRLKLSGGLSRNKIGGPERGNLRVQLPDTPSQLWAAALLSITQIFG